ncbi:uncharacterized protein N7503_009128 [Penicillium pulvis]|uniref:uncharacterized protein n=1 Tax=Penicillium pulvis TaxID=1562058 RepID=UPI0025490F1C|nr:uncharacterized protein N7503_009128 [Penicillium pulvis]KAJ5793150.1 hypothetical protein N7503_009128 [Penicillium pulvis]
MIKTLLVSLLLSVNVDAQPSTHCRCRLNDSCWPSLQQWSTLNDTLGNKLVAVRPVASVCSPGEFNAAACKNVRDLWTDSVWRSSQPGAVQWENWEAWPQQNQSCYIETANMTCGQGRISLYSAKVQSTSDIQQVVRFAQDHNLRLAIKNTGHDFLGRSTAPESLQILTHDMKDINLVDDFVPNGAPKNISDGPAVHLAAGVQLPELYAAVERHNRTVIVGSSHSVGAAGGYIQGGGHSPFGAWKGLASDNALEFELVVANGSLVTANLYQNTDLFWALRGGGGGTFGVVTRATIRTFPDVPVIAYNLNFTTSATNPQFWDAWEEWHAALPSLNAAGGSGYYFTMPNLPLNANMSVSSMYSLLMFPEKTNVTEIQLLYLPLILKLQKIPGVATQKMAIPLPSINSTVFGVLLGGPPHDSTGSIAMLASRLYSKDLLLSKDGPSRLTSAWKSIGWAPGSRIVGHVVAGGAVAANGEKIDSAVNPAWRKTVTHLLFGRSWSATATPAEQTAIIKNMTEVQIPILRSVEGADHMGAYLNEANAYEPGFQKSFWGDNYSRLYSIKQKWDPNGLFIARKGVGSEDWDDAGLCRIKSSGPSVTEGPREWPLGY